MEVVSQLQVGVRGSHRDEKNVIAAALDANESGCQVLVFSRDRDREVERQAAVDRGIERAAALFPVRIGGGVAVEVIEAWMLALAGKLRTESLSRDGAKRAAPGTAVGELNLAGMAADATSLRLWLERVAAALKAT